MIYQGKKKTYSTDSLARDLYQLWRQAQEIGLPSIQKILMFLPKIMWSLSYVSRMQIGKRIRHGIADPNEEFIYDYIKEKLCIVKTQQEDSEMSSNLSEALELYRPAWLILTKMKISIEETDAPETGLRLIEPGNACLTRLLETLFGCRSRFDYMHCIMMCFEGFVWKRRKELVILTSSETAYLKGHLYLDI